MNAPLGKNEERRLPYVLTLDRAGLLPWGDGTGGTQPYFDPHPPRNQTVRVPIFAHIPPGQKVVPNQIFSDLVSVVIFY
jgi:hypothetical protein